MENVSQRSQFLHFQIILQPRVEFDERVRDYDEEKKKNSQFPTIGLRKSFRIRSAHFFYIIFLYEKEGTEIEIEKGDSRSFSSCFSSSSSSYSSSSSQFKENAENDF